MVSLAKVSVFIATSLDGYIARKDGRIDWLEKANATLPTGEDCGYQSFFDSVDTLVMGRKTFETVLAFEAWPYGDKRVVVLSTQLKQVPPHLAKTVSVLSFSPKKILETLSAEGSRHIYLDGGRTIQSFLMDNLVDEITVTSIPVLLGDGISLFGNVRESLPLTHLKTDTYSNGFVQSKYRVQRGL
jgi:dihydrofolate reductase